MSAARVLKYAAGIVGVLIALGLVALLVLWRSVSGGGGATVSEQNVHDFGTVVQGERVEHAFALPNEGEGELVIAAVTSWIGSVTGVDSVIPPGGSGRIALALETDRAKGPVRGQIRVEFGGDRGGETETFELRGRVVLPLELVPQERVYFFTVVGEAPEKDVELINHLDQPLEITGVVSDNPLFRVRSSMVERGRRFRFTVALDSTAPVGRHDATLTVSTSSEAYPSLEILGRAWVKDIVSTSVAEVSFSRVEFEALDIKTASQRTIRVERHRGSGFRVLRATTDLPFLDTEIEAEEKDQSFLVVLRIMPDEVGRGAFTGTLTIETNDPDFPTLELPIKGEIL